MPSVVIAGGGLAGAAAGAALARAGANVTIIEREAAPVDKICGEFLSTEAQDYLTRLGLDFSLLGGHRISRLLLVRGGNAVATPLPFQGIGLSRFALDEALLNHAAACGAVVRRGRAISRVETGGAITLHIPGMADLQAETLFLATGKHDLRGLRRDAPPPEDLTGFKMYFRLNAAAQAALAGHVALMAFRRGYAGLQLVEGGKANLCLLADGARLKDCGGKFPALLEDLCRESPYLRRMLDGAVALLDQPLTIARVPYGYVYQPRPADPPRIFRLGDQAGVIPSFTGDGMAIALHSAALAVAAHLAGKDAAFYHLRLAADITGQIRRAGMIYHAAQGRVTPALMFRLAQFWPQSLRLAASLTRVPLQARL
jgi:flavin-dependent dehydrogenase